MNSTLKSILTWTLALILIFPAFAQPEKQTLYSKAEIEQLVAPIALYPDSLLSQILMASTYPLEIVSAARWVKENPKLKGAELEAALKQQKWDESVKSLTTVPDVLKTMSDKLEMTQKLGDAFLAQQQDVLEAIQRLRNMAQEKGHLKSSKEQVVNVTQAPAATPSKPSVITIEQTDPNVVYVPVYDPNVVYGEWPYPEYPPYDYYPYGYSPAAALLTFATAAIVGNALWGHFDWGNRYVNIDVNRYNKFNGANINGDRWQHHPEHRGNVPYRDKVTQHKYGRDQIQNTQSREAFRDRAEQGRQQLSQERAQSLKQAKKSPQQQLANKKPSHAKSKAKAQQARKPSQQARKPSQQARHPSRNYNGGRGAGQHRPPHHNQARKQHTPQRATHRGSQQRSMHRGSSNRGSFHGGGGRRR
ncbi:DUF3300 domain-containing protein [Candidatus Berkiella aquae]|uniref:DUF3300 domain-containing protein n=1 Tax=Candidatus Berkiella aquae TaxID=295108 RepID=A0A0Q9YLH5_9GAMM|nr:DUF3300 domain-containing protein [Candidatus Berkiella aquae]MCS5711504.1 DUF3300 domain-containing protein [Candidatus Berkiella aquae]